MNRVLKYKDAAEKWSRRTQCPAALILAVIEMESGGDPLAMRYEPDYEKRYMSRCREIAKAANITTKEAATSYGLMQLMLPLAWGYMSEGDKAAPVEALFDADKNIRYGAAHLSALINKELAKRNVKDIDAPVIRAVSGAYNGAGSDSEYARAVCALWNKYKEALSC